MNEDRRRAVEDWEREGGREKEREREGERGGRERHTSSYARREENLWMGHISQAALSVNNILGQRRTSSRLSAKRSDEAFFLFFFFFFFTVSWHTQKKEKQWHVQTLLIKYRMHYKFDWHLHVFLPPQAVNRQRRSVRQPNVGRT